MVMSEITLQIRLNGDPIECPAGLSLLQLLELRGIGAERKLPPPMRPPLAASAGWGKSTTTARAAPISAGNIKRAMPRR